MSSGLIIESDVDIEVERFVSNVRMDMEDEDFSTPQKIIAIELLSEYILEVKVKEV